MELTVREAFGLAGSLVLLAAFSVAVSNGRGIAQILSVGSSSFANVINAATRPAR